jgi:phenylacetate-CoA ligase
MRGWLAWNVLFRLHERLKGHSTLRLLREMEAADRLSVPELEQLQRRKLRELIAYCYANVPYIRMYMQQAGVKPEDIRGPEDLPLLPIMRKADVQKNRLALRSKSAGHLSSFSTGGSTGSPLIFDISKRRVSARVALRQRANRWWGVSVGDPEIVIWGSPIELTRQDRIRRTRDWLLRTELLSAYEMNEEAMSQYLNVIEKRRPRQIFAYPSSMYQLSRHAQKKGRNLRQAGIRVILVTSEVLYPHQRELIIDTFGCPVANGYGGRDSGFISHECPQGGMHLMADAVITELLDANGQNVAPGEAGEIVITDLYSHEFPFLRYATGDIGVLSTRRCGCGRPLPLLERIDGRSNDSVVAPDGRVMHGQALISIIMEIPGIEQFRIHQKDVNRFHVQLVSGSEFRKESEELIRRGWSKRLRVPLRITFEYVPVLPTERSGKVRHIVSDLSAGNSLREPGAQSDHALAEN